MLYVEAHNIFTTITDAPVYYKLFFMGVQAIPWAIHFAMI